MHIDGSNVDYDVKRINFCYLTPPPPPVFEDNASETTYFRLLAGCFKSFFIV